MNHALVVDDSRTSRAVLKQMLKKESCRADAVASAEAALDYLQTQTPNVIFMDHMMPGMDGFAAVRMIKSDPATAHIPIVMYTSRDGEVYVGQAQALGAADLLSKPATQDELRATLHRVTSAVAARPVVPRTATATVVPIENASNEPVNEPAVEQVDYETYAEEPIVVPAPQSFIDELPPPDLPNTGFTPPQFSPSRISWLGPLVLLGCLVGILMWGSFKYFSMQERENRLLATQQQLLQSFQWTINQAGQYRYNELPMAGQRLELLRELVENLRIAGAKGTVVVEGHVGQYCLVQNKRGGFVKPNDALPIADCDVIGDEKAVASQRSSGQSAAFTEYLQQLPELGAGTVAVKVIGKGASQPRLEYPAESIVRTAGDWNRIADQNNRVEYYLVPED